LSSAASLIFKVRRPEKPQKCPSSNCIESPESHAFFIERAAVAVSTPLSIFDSPMRISPLIHFPGISATTFLQRIKVSLNPLVKPLRYQSTFPYLGDGTVCTNPFRSPKRRLPLSPANPLFPTCFQIVFAFHSPRSAEALTSLYHEKFFNPSLAADSIPSLCRAWLL